MNYRKATIVITLIRMAKLFHYSGELDSAISHMLHAADVASNLYVKQAALTNVGDLYLHDGELERAYELYKNSVTANSCDFHSLVNIGWLALVHDGNNALAEKIFEFARQKTKSPDPLLKLSKSSELKHTLAAKQYATQFVTMVRDSIYGNMYNKYLIDVYTGILNDPTNAVIIAKKELENRQTPQTYAWLAWAMASAGKIEEALGIFREKVSGKPLEGLELYWMGKLMKMAGKGYNARQFFTAAEKNRYDLSPAQAANLDMELQ